MLACPATSYKERHIGAYSLGYASGGKSSYDLNTICLIDRQGPELGYAQIAQPAESDSIKKFGLNLLPLFCKLVQIKTLLTQLDQVYYYRLSYQVHKRYNYLQSILKEEEFTIFKVIKNAK